MPLAPVQARPFRLVSVALATALALTFALLTGCATKTVSVTDADEFGIMARRITPLLQSRQILDSEGAYVAPLIPLAGLFQTGDYLYQHLSPAFRFQLDPSLLPPSFAATQRPGDSIEIRANGFLLRQGSESVQVQKLAEVDWNSDGRTDWLLLCRVDSPAINEKRDYYLVVEDVEATPLVARLIAAYDCRNQTCNLFVEPGPGTSLAPETQVLEGTPGQRAIIPPPNSPAPEGMPKPTIQEKKLGG